MLPQEIIRKKRNGEKLAAGDINAFIAGIPDGRVAGEQIAAFCMAVFLQKMDMQERVMLTTAMAGSGTVLDWSAAGLDGPVLDKHSTGGIGDKVSLMLAPLVAALGGYVPMLSGRGLGHTGGTLDKMDAITGYASQPDIDVFRRVVKECGCAIIGATPDLAPADRMMYAVRDVTATVESLDLITASILSKKMAAGLDGLVMDVKFGNGAFMADYADAQALAESIVAVANGGGLPTVGLLTDMNQVLGTTAGNAVEVKEAVDYLKGENMDPRLHAVTVSLTAELLVLGGLFKDTVAAAAAIENAIHTGTAAEKFAKMVHALGGPADFIDAPEKYLAPAPVVRDYVPPATGTLSAIDTRGVGIGIVEMGGGRTRPSDTIDHAVGLTRIAPVGTVVGTGAAPLATIHARDEDSWQRMADKLSSIITLDGVADKDKPLVAERIAA